MPVGTQGSVKTLSQEDLEALGVGIILGNTYHLYLRPGASLIQDAGGLHAFMGWGRAILTDSGGFQVRSLAALNKVSEEGVIFQSHVDGSKHLFTSERVVQTQHRLGSDIMMMWDECTKFPCTEEEARASGERTLRWGAACLEAYDALDRRSAAGQSQALFGIVQGSVYPSLRERFTDETVSMNFPGYAVGGTFIGERKTDTWMAVETVIQRLPENKPRYLMGCGPPQDLAEGVARGVDMFDCVVPTRNARNGTVFTREGKLNVRGGAFKDDLSPLDEQNPMIARYTRAYVRHLLQVGEVLGLRLATLCSVSYFLELMCEMRRAIIDKAFADWLHAFRSGPYGSTDPEKGG